MTKKYSTKKALISSIVVLALCFSMLIGTTFAWFTDSATSTGNIIKTGNLDVEMYYADGTEAVPTTAEGWTDASTGAIFNYDNWEPGYVDVKHVQIKNNGTLALKYQVRIMANGEVSDLSDVIDVYYVDPAQAITDRAQLTADNYLGTLTAVLAGLDETASGKLEAEEAHTITLALKMQESAGNQYQNKSIGTDFSVIVLATQATAEDDSFDDQYDADATFAAEFNNFKAALANAQAGDTVTLNLTHDAYLAAGEVMIAPEGVDIVVNGNGHTIYADKATHVIAGKQDTDIVIKDLTIVGKTTDDAIISQNNGVGDPVNIVMENVKVNLTDIKGVNWPVCFGGTGTATLTNCEITGAGLDSGDYADGNHFFAGAKMNVTFVNTKVGSVMLNGSQGGDSATLNIDADSKIGTVYLEAKDRSVVTGSVENVDEMIIPVKNAGDMKQAIESASADTTVYIALAGNFNATEAIAVAAGVNLVVYGEGKTVTTTGMQDKYFIKSNGGTVEINDLTVTGDAKYAFYSVGGKAVMNNVKVNMDGNYKVCFYGGGVTELNNCTINGNASFVSIWFGDGRTVTINGGTYSSMCINASIGAGVGSAGTLVVNDATVDIIYGGAYEANGEVVRASITTNNSTVGRIEYEQ